MLTLIQIVRVLFRSRMPDPHGLSEHLRRDVGLPDFRAVRR